MAQLTHGMDVAAVRSSMGKIEQLAAQIDALRGQLDSEMTALLAIWSGQDANQYVNTTWPPFNSNLKSLFESLNQLAAAGKQQATQQETTSSA